MAAKLITNYLPEIVALGFIRTKPGMVTVNLTSRCNQRCIYCEIGIQIPTLRKDVLTVDDLKWIIDQMVENKIRKISLCGGEPFLFDGIFDVVAYAGKKKIRTSITTNGMSVYNLTEQQLTILKEAQTEINLSIDSFQDPIQSFTRGTNTALPNALKSFQVLTEKQIPVTVLTVISKYNYRNLSSFFTEAWEKGIKQILFQPVIYYSNYPDQPVIDEKSQLNVGMDEIELLMDELKTILRFEKNHTIKTNVYRIFPWIGYYLKTAATQDGKWFFDNVLKKFFCREIYAIIDISYDGGIQPCGLSPATISIHKNREPGLLALWSQATGAIKKDLSNGRFYDICNGCCHHFSRNMLASIFKYFVKNRRALITLVPLLFSRIKNRMLKKLFLP